MDIKTKPKFHRKSQGRRISWEIYSWKHFFITVSLGNFEMQVNHWPLNESEIDNYIRT